MRRIERRPNASGHSATYEGGTVQRNVLWNFHHRPMVQQHRFGKPGEVHELMDGFTPDRKARGFVRRALAETAVGTQMRPSLYTLRTFAAEQRGTGNDVIPHRHVAYPRADGDDSACRLMTENCRARRADRSVHGVQITVAHAAGDGFHEHFVGTRITHIDIFDGERLVDFAENSGLDLHGSSSVEIEREAR